MFSATSCPNRFLVWARALHPASTSAVRSCDLRHIHPKTSRLKLSLSLMYRAWSGVAAVALRLVQIWCLWVLEAFTTTSATWLFHSACSVVPSWSTLLSSVTRQMVLGIVCSSSFTSNFYFMYLWASFTKERHPVWWYFSSNCRLRPSVTSPLPFLLTVA